MVKPLIFQLVLHSLVVPLSLQDIGVNKKWHIISLFACLAAFTLHINRSSELFKYLAKFDGIEIVLAPNNPASKT